MVEGGVINGRNQATALPGWSASQGSGATVVGVVSVPVVQRTVARSRLHHSLRTYIKSIRREEWQLTTCR